MNRLNVTQVLQMAIAVHGQGKLADAEQYYRQILSAEPGNADALHLLGVLMQQRGQTQTAIDLIRRAISINPKAADFHSNLANIHRQIRQPAAAVEHLRIACDLQPASASLRHRLGLVLMAELNQLAEATEALRAAVAIDPKSAPVLSALALAIHRQSDPAGALPIYEQAIALAPRDIALMSNYASALTETGQSDRAIETCENALKIDPTSALVWYNLGVVQMSLEKNGEAQTSFENALKFDPAHPMAKVNIAGVRRAQGFLEESARIYEELLQKHPGWGPLHSNLGLTRLAQGRHDEAISEMRRAIVLDPDRQNVWDNLLFSLHYHLNDPAQLYEDHRAWAERLENKCSPRILTTDRSPNRCLRIGYVSPDLRQHSVMFFIEPILAHHNREQFEVFCYANHPACTEITVRLRGQADHFQHIQMFNDDAAADLIIKDKIDILVDLAVHTTGNRLGIFARKPAPLQGTYLGYAGTTGLRAIDFRLTDGWIDPPGLSEQFNTEELVRLPDTQWVYRPLADSPEVSALPAESNGFITFAVATNLAKINEPTIQTWCRVLQDVPQSRLIIKGTGMEDTGTARQFRALFAKFGIPAERLEFQPSSPMGEYLQFFSRVDIVLDTFPFAGGTTSCHALYMGVPVITRTGNTSVSRVGSSILHNVGLPELIADSPEKFVQIASALANDPKRLGTIRNSLRERMKQSPLMDETRFVKNLELAYRQLWKQSIRAG